MIARNLLLLSLTIFALVEYATAQVAFTSRFSRTSRGNIDIIGNVIRTCQPSQVSGGVSCEAAQAGANKDLYEYTSVFIDVDSDATTSSSSSATLALPSGASVAFAGLYWRGTTSSGTRNTAKFRYPGTGSYVDLTADAVQASGNNYQSYKNVTSTVASAGNGEYFVGNIETTYDGGWGLVVVYELASETPRTMVVYDGHTTGSSAPITLSGFLAPPTGTVNATVGVIAGSGDRTLSGDGISFAGTSLSDVLNPSNNIFNSTISKRGVDFTAKNPNYQNSMSFDIDLLSANGILSNSATSATVAFSTSGDFYTPSVLTIAIDTYEPSFASNFTKGLVDVNAGLIERGDTLYYEFVLKNVGNDPAQNVVFSDIIPTGLTYVPGTLEIVSGTGTGVFSDTSGDDRAEVSGAAVTFRLGVGATGSAGGTMAVNDEVRFRFAVTVNSSVTSGTNFSNAASLSFVGASSSANYTSQSEAVPGGTIGDALVVGLGTAQPTPAFTPFTASGTPTPLPTATATAVPTGTPTAAPTVEPNDRCPLPAPSLTRQGNNVRVNFSRRGRTARDFRIIIRRTSDGLERRVISKAGKELPFFRGVRAGAWKAFYIEIRNRTTEICSKKTDFTIR